MRQEVTVTESQASQRPDRIALRFAGGAVVSRSGNIREAPEQNILQLMQVLGLVDTIWTSSFLIAAYTTESAVEDDAFYDDEGLAAVLELQSLPPLKDFAIQLLETAQVRRPGDIRYSPVRPYPTLNLPEVPRPAVRVRMQSPLELELLKPFLGAASGVGLGVAGFQVAKWALTHPREIGGFLPNLLTAWFEGWTAAERAKRARRVLVWQQQGTPVPADQSTAGLLIALQAAAEMDAAARELDQSGRIDVEGDGAADWPAPRA